MLHCSQSLADRAYVELVRSLYVNITPSVIMSAAFALAVLLIHSAEENAMILIIGAAGMVASIARLVITQALRRRTLTNTLSRPQARQLEIAFAVPYLLFAVCLGAFGAHVLWLPLPEAHMLVVCLLVGYCAGAATGTGLRPYIAIPSMTVAIGPTIIAGAFTGSPIYLGMSAISFAFLLGGSQSVLLRHNTANAELGNA